MICVADPYRTVSLIYTLSFWQAIIYKKEIPIPHEKLCG
jgi:hypothetical protein